MKKGIITLLVISIMLLVGLTKVKAEQLYVDGYDTEWYQENSRTNQLPHNNGFSYRSFSASNFNNPGYQTIDFYTKSGGVPVNNIRSGEFTIPFYVSAPTIGISTTNTQQMIERTCTNFVCTNNSGTTCTQYTCNQWQNENVGSNTSSDMEYIEPVVNIQALVVYNTGYLDICSVDKNLNQIKCPVASLSNIESINFIRVIATAYYPGTTNPGNNIVVGLYRKINRYKNSTNAIIDNQNQNTDEIINQNATYQDTPSKDMTNETQELDNFEQAEQGLINSLDLNMSVMDGITINPNASAYIWQIVDRLRQINPAIILLMTSILGMGIIKMVLNR